MSDFDRDLAGLSDEEGSEDAYYAQMPSGTGAPKKKSAAGASADTDEDEEDDAEPSVEELIHQQESGISETAATKAKKIADNEEEEPLDDLAMIDEAAKDVEAERDELFKEDEEEM